MSGDKFRTTIYLTPAAMKKLNQICASNLLHGNKQDKSATICYAIEYLYDFDYKSDFKEK